MALAMPETVKIARVGWVHATPKSEGQAFRVPLGPDEVMVLLSVFYWFTGVLVAGANTVELTLWKKTDEDPPAFGFDDSPDIVHHVRTRREFVTESLDAGGGDHIVFPWPLVLIRPPRLFVRTGITTSANGEMRLYYLLRKVSDLDLAKLMVKDHA